jgi:hypothetical protein
MQVMKGDQNGYLVPGIIAGQPCLRRYKYGGLAFQVGVGQQAINPSLLNS